MSFMSFPFAKELLLPNKATHVVLFTGVSSPQDKGKENKEIISKMHQIPNLRIFRLMLCLGCLSAIASVVLKPHCL